MTQKTILIVDDSEIVLTVTQARLEQAGYRVVTQTRATGTVSLILQLEPDLVLLDVNMPALQGDAVAKMVAGTTRVRKTIVLLHSSLDTRTLEQLTKTCGAQGFIQKTDNSFTLLRSIRRFLGDSISSTLGRSENSKRLHQTEATPRPGGVALQTNGCALLVDRDMSSLARLRGFLRQQGRVTEFALSSAQAERKLAGSSPPSIVIASASLPNDGADALFQAALALDADWAQRFILTCINPAIEPMPRGFGGRVLTVPVNPKALERAISDIIAPSRDPRDVAQR